MDGRDAMSMPGAPYYLHRGIQQQPGPHVNTAQPPMPGMMLMHNSGPNMAVPPSGIGGLGSFQVEAPLAVSSLADGSGGGVAVGGSVSSRGTSQGEPVKRKRGRPRKYGMDGNVALALSPLSSAPSGSALASRAPGQKRGRGRPPGTGRKQQMASLGEWFSGSAGMDFTPHIITIAVGEDITTKIMSFSQQGGRAICILSANGAVNTVTIRKPETSGGTVTYKGPFEIICLSGAYVLADNDESRSRRGGLSISLCNSDGRLIAGVVGGLLEAATPVQVILGSFMPGGSKVKKKKKKTSHESGESDFQSIDRLNAPSTPSITAFSNQNVITPSPVVGGWPGPRQLDMRNAHLDIDLTRE